MENINKKLVKKKIVIDYLYPDKYKNTENDNWLNRQLTINELNIMVI